eukprot:7367938-Lingulodinium_polyedra.AAC.1
MQQQRLQPRKSVAELTKGLWANPSQSVDRFPAASHLPTLTKNAVLYSYEHDRVFSSESHVRLMGRPR